MTRVAILVSGRGSNMVRLVEDMRGDHPGHPVLVVANRPDAGGLEAAEALGVPARCVDQTAFGGDRAGFDAALAEALEPAAPDLICLAGFMRILGAGFVARYARRILNIHPSLLPKYPGLDTHARALAAGETEAGCTVHEVTAELDGGPILGQARVPVRPGDRVEDLASRVLAMEHRLYPAVLRRVCEGRRAPLHLG